MSANGARILGLDGELGTVAPGKLADLIVIEGDIELRPSDIRNVRIVFKDGLGYDPDSLTAAVAGQVGVR